MRPRLPSRKPRSRAKAGPAFVFVETTESSTGKPREEDVRVLIRRQAARSGRKHQRMQSARQGSNDSDTPGQPGTLVLHTVNVEGVYPTATADDDSVDHSIAPQPSFTGYEALRVIYNFDITYLASFTHVDLGKTAALPLQTQPNLISSLLQQRSTSFLSYLPSRYGSSPCLDDAMQCLAARAGQMFGHTTRAATISTLYGKALISLQSALGDGKLCMGADVYCATRLLTLYELISSPESNHWVLHNRGGIRLLEARGPQNHKSRFDWMLLKSVAPSILLDEMYRLRSSSIFEEPAWQRLFDYASKTETDRDASLWWEFFGLVCYVTGVAIQLREIFTTSLTQDEYELRTSKVLARARWIHKMFHDGHIRYQMRDPYPLSLFDLPITIESPDRVRLRGFYFHPRMQICRVLATISPDDMERAAAEVEAQTLAAQAVLIQKATVELDPAMSWYFAQKNPFAHGVIRSREEWVPHSDLPWGELRGVLAQRWLKWHFGWRVSHLSESLEDAFS
ncbi:uncharacterized protein BDV17DRAFT_286551 [Aspergillus undulatus]|uniref:uncharacterized protein n=1 Tax=Aspergillus undulatus TaxID=1810928 RepID=UPI003CCCCA88